MDVIGVIPARYESSRFPGKVLANILGRTMIQWVWEAASKAHLLEDLIIATDDEKVMKAIEAFGGKGILTSKGHLSGADRICEIVNPLDVKVIVNIQGDEPLIKPAMIDDLASVLVEDPSTQMVTLKHEIQDRVQLHDPNIVKVVTDKDGFALYFSRSCIPYQVKQTEGSVFSPHGVYKHIGMYAYTKDFLFSFANFIPSSLEKAESLEQLRVLEHGCKIKVVETKYDSISVDTPRDLDEVKKRIQ
ncbi:MAG: 3-deoxy-manno-octulosonate cytidylyltransferase [Candidatus Omnitrophota bacterium]|nr:3-deoxy-manno-octulosonate cytidylyltransferase [Candidatus Omnitrophota bacterium]